MRLSPLIPPVWWAPVHCRQSVRPAVLSVRRQRQAANFDIVPFFSVNQIQYNPNQFNTFTEEEANACPSPPSA